MPELIRLERLTKIFHKSFTAVDSLDLSIPKGEIFALLGPNGAGKTTTLRMISGLCMPTSGSVQIGGIGLKDHRMDYLRRIGVVSQEFNVDTELSGEENMLVHAYLHGYRRGGKNRRIDELFRFAGLGEERKKTVDTYSGGMKRKLQILRALLHDPDVLFLDEPTVGLDAHSREKIWNFIKKLNERSKTVFFTTHYIEEAENNADRVGIIHRGKLIRLGEAKKMIAEIGVWCRETFVNNVTIRSYHQSREEAEQCTEDGYQRFTVRRTHLEDVFIRLTGEEELL